jgi:hypothetical protein
VTSAVCNEHAPGMLGDVLLPNLRLPAAAPAAQRMDASVLEGVERLQLHIFEVRQHLVRGARNLRPDALADVGEHLVDAWQVFAACSVSTVRGAVSLATSSSLAA